MIETCNEIKKNCEILQFPNGNEFNTNEKRKKSYQKTLMLKEETHREREENERLK